MRIWRWRFLDRRCQVEVRASCDLNFVEIVKAMNDEVHKGSEIMVSLDRT